MIRISAFADEAAKNFDGQIAALKKHGLEYIDIRSADGCGVKDFTPEMSQEYAARLKGEGIGVNCIASPLGKVDIKGLDFSAYAELAKRIFNIANIFETDKIRVFSFYNSKDERSRVYDYMNRLVLIAAGFGLVLYNENEEGVFTEGAEEAAKLLSGVPGLQNIFDGGNYVLCGEQIDKAINLLAEKTNFFHIKDATVSGEIVPPGQGDAKIAQMLKNRDDIFITLEPHLYKFTGLSNLSIHELKYKNSYSSPGEAFDAGVNAFKNLLSQTERKNV